MAGQPLSVRVAILGAGMSGLCMGAKLRRAGFDNFVILEKADSVGGTWRENTYPGVACDVPSHLYSFSFDLNPNWSHSYGEGSEIWHYCEAVAEKYDLTRHIRFRSTVEDVRFDGRRWIITTAGQDQVIADIVVSGLGGLHLPKHADLPGRDDFAGTLFHTAEWNHDHDLMGRRVAIVGTGASAVQVLPSIAPMVKDVTVFQRSAAWVFPRLTHEISERRRTMFRRLPFLMRLYRSYLWLTMDAMGIQALRWDGVLKDRLKKVALDFLEQEVEDPDVRAKLTPDYEPGCKRRCISDDYLRAFNRANVHLVTDPITAIEAEGIRDGTGRLHGVDTIIEATGFRPFDISDYVTIAGREGARLQDVWKDRVESFRTMMVPGFPNFFMLLGPNSATGHTSALIMIESQADYVLSCIKLMNRKKIEHLDPKQDVTAAYNQRLQDDMKDMVFASGCNAWYTDDNDSNFTLWPYSAWRFIREQSRVQLKEFEVTPRHRPSGRV
ncbi:MAG: flavin-containing monooxygenase [Alphaproteobacteria bacterium]